MYGANVHLVFVILRVFVCVKVCVYWSRSAGISSCRTYLEGGRQLEVVTFRIVYLLAVYQWLLPTLCDSNRA